jgi:uncharacterized membrane protein YoaK (UPF0700 family)
MMPVLLFFLCFLLCLDWTVSLPSLHNIQRFANGGSLSQNPQPLPLPQQHGDVVAEDTLKGVASSENVTATATTTTTPPMADALQDFPESTESSSSSSSSSLLSPTPTQKKKSLLMISLLIMSGITEGICFRRFKCFPNMMTGNTVRCMDALADWNLGMFGLHGSMIVSYVTGGALFRVMEYTSSTRQTYQHLQASNNRLLLAWVARVSLVLFCLSDIVGVHRDLWRLPFLALGCGLINAAANDTAGTVTNAVTGHWTKIGLGTGEALLLPSLSKENVPTTTTTTTTTNRSSVKGVSAFVVSLLGTNVVYRWLERTQPWLLSRLPPLGTSLGVSYALLFGWYSRSSQ